MSLNGRALSYSFLANLLLSISFLVSLNNIRLTHCPIIDLSLADEVHLKVEILANSDQKEEFSVKADEVYREKKASFKERPLRPSQGVISEEDKRGEERRLVHEETHVGETVGKKGVWEDSQSYPFKQAKTINDYAKEGEGEIGKIAKGMPAVDHVSPEDRVFSNKNEELKVAKFQNYQRYYEERNWRIVRDLVERHLSYPPQAVMMGWKGRTVVKLCIESSKLCGQEIVESSGFKILDEAVLVAVKKTDGKLPFSEQRVFLLLPIKFELQGVR